MTGFVVLVILMAALVLGLQLAHRSRDRLSVPGVDVRDDADHRRLVAELRTTPTESGPRHQELDRQELVRLAA